MNRLPVCAFEQHLGTHRVIDDFDGAIVDGPNRRVVQARSLSLAEVVFLGLDEGWCGLKASHLSTLDLTILRSIQNQAVLVAMNSDGMGDSAPNSILSEYARVAAFLLSESARADASDQNEAEPNVRFGIAGRRLGLELKAAFDACRETLEVLEHYPSTHLLPCLNRHMIFAEPGDLERYGIALDPAKFLAFERGETVVPVLPSQFLWELRNGKGRAPKSDLAERLFDLASAFCVVLNKEATELCRVTGDRRASAALKRECVDLTILTAGFGSTAIDGRGAGRESWVESTVLRRGGAVLLDLPPDVIALWAFDENAPSTPPELPPHERYSHALNTGRLKPLAATIKLLFHYAKRAAAIEAYGYRELRRGRSNPEVVPEIADTDAYGIIAEADPLLLSSLDSMEPDPWTRLALDFGINLAPLYPSLGYLTPTLQAALAVRRLLASGDRVIADTEDRIEILPLFHLFQTESLDGGLPPALRTARRVLRGHVRRLGLEAEATRNPLDRQVLLPISETDRARIRIALAARGTGNGA